MRRRPSLQALAVAIACALSGATLGCGSGDGAPTGPTRFRFPGLDPDGTRFVRDVVFHVDDDGKPTDGLLSQIFCTNFEGRGFPQCYGDHDGSDFLLVGGFAAMDAGSTDVLAAADGVVEVVDDGHYDHCHISLAALDSGGISCDGNPIVPNKVYIRHRDGIQSQYLHMKKDSIVVTVGQHVRCGEKLGIVGSSGRSSTPHVHFEVHGADDALIDPFAGDHSQPESYWVEQVGPFGLPAPTCQR